jgi:hypothetical protein
MAAGADETASPERPPEERYGVLLLDRRHKDDGRALILYSHDEDVEEPDESAAHEHDADAHEPDEHAAVEPRDGASVNPDKAGEQA